jgi:predicted nucleic acid-binding protein
MPLVHAFIETNFLFRIFCTPSKRHRDALALKKRFEAGEVKFYVPYVCFQEVRHIISKSLEIKWRSALREYHQFAVATGQAVWDFEEVRKFLDAATAEVNRTKAVYQSELADFASTLGDGIIHGTNEVFDLLESLDLDDELEYNDKLILGSVLWKAKVLRAAGASQLFFASIDKKHLEPAPDHPKITKYYAEVGLVFLPGFVLPDTSP